MTNSNKPITKLQDGNLSAAIWKNDGDKGPYHTVTFSRFYKDASGQLRDTNTMRSSDLLKLAHLASHAYDFIAKQ